eukprot:Colp12_sorted_trinity150504_noHs@28411
MSLGHYFTDAGQTPTYTDLFGLFSSLPTDLSGKMVIKATLGEEIRRIPLINDDLTYDELILMMQRIFRGKITPADEILIKYKDEDGDLVTISDNVDLAHAKLNMKVLRIHLFLNVSSGGHSHSTPVPNVEEVKKELTAMRDRLNELIGKLEIAQQQAVKDKEAAKPAAAEVDQKPAAVRLNSSDIENFLGGSGEKKDAIHPSVGSMFQQKQGQSQPIAQPRQAQPTSSTQYGPPPPFTNAPGPAPQQQSHTGYQQQPQPIPQQQQQQPVFTTAAAATNAAASTTTASYASSSAADASSSSCTSTTAAAARSPCTATSIPTPRLLCPACTASRCRTAGTIPRPIRHAIGSTRVHATRPGPTTAATAIRRGSTNRLCTEPSELWLPKWPAATTGVCTPELLSSQVRTFGQFFGVLMKDLFGVDVDVAVAHSHQMARVV